MTYRFNAIPIKIAAKSFIDIEDRQYYSKMCMGDEDIKIAEMILMENLVGGIRN